LRDHPRCLFVSKRWGHHSSSSGYDILPQHLSGHIISRPENFSLFSKWRRRLLARSWQRPEGHFDYRYEDLWLERKAILYSSTGLFPIAHYIYGDEQLDLLLRAKKYLRSKLVATFHLLWTDSSPWLYKKRNLWNQALDGVIGISGDLSESLKEIFDPHKVCFIPHGVDTETYCPSPVPKGNSLRLLTVGQHQRDLKLIQEMAQKCLESKCPIFFEYVGKGEAADLFRALPNVLCRSGISEAELIGAYQTSHALLLPLLAGTANNALLEAMACGLPAISTKVGGIPDYLDTNSGWLFPPGDVESISKLVEHLSKNPVELVNKSKAARAKAETFSWSGIAKQVLRFYDSVLQQKRKKPS